ncbi:hypothetical protein F5876DRAFT_65589 [Lentinula aff. lateritia]|uniref:Uncharacterized protein n=1 Tax=Lentinula aff. lateritia TaxID=2804960 RepID=A0ACC1U152_9AGAR|nr:hypothetical protein F5876DRAFT_65589 [Lentinula aff. lateritia]
MWTSPSSARKFLDNYLVELFLHALYSMVPHRLLHLRTRHLRQHKLLVVGDAIVVWRTCNMWTKHKSLRYLLSTLMLGNLATNIADVLIDTTTDAADHEIVMDYVSTSVSFVVNLLSTILVFIKACSRHTRIRRILRLLIESGVAFCFIQAVYVLVQILLYQNETYSLSLWNLALVMVRNAAAVLYPLAVFIVVNLDQSQTNNRNVPEPAFTTISQGDSLHSLEGNPVVG